ncbi:PHP domain-containing protein [Ancrocorticia populi]|uniref:PHP domain-containing protein n=1 Tax=Ancrocorticia populi TaxID=2175228 RepID=UPI0023572E03|nr:PHP domain-containing protein [Ancrocorticia populi]
MRIDPHTHTTRSDGRSTPSALMAEAAVAGIDMIGLTDHDTVSGWEEAANTVETSGVALIRGMEISAMYHGITLHMLGYLFDPDAPAITEHMRQVRESRVERAREMVARLGRDFPITWEDVTRHLEPGATVGRPHIADALVEAGVVESRAQAFDHLLKARSPYYVWHKAAEATEAIEWINAAGGRAVFAHPAAPHRNRVVPVEAFEEFAEAGLFGIEIDHRDNLEAARPELAALADRLDLARFGSSDYHGLGKPNRLGENTTSPAVIQALIQSCQLEVLYP